jgi:hypothetical protein
MKVTPPDWVCGGSLHGSLHIVLSLVLSRSWPVHQLDVKNAFLHGNLTESQQVLWITVVRIWSVGLIGLSMV